MYFGNCVSAILAWDLVTTLYVPDGKVDKVYYYSVKIE